MRAKHIHSAFTLVELMVVIAIISALVIWSMRVDLSRLTQKQQTGLELVQINNIFEEIRNNALIGRWVGVDVQNPDSWGIDISVQNWGEIQAYSTLAWTNTPSPQGTWSAQENREILEISCRSLDWSSSTPLTGTGTLNFVWDQISMSGTGCDSFNQTVLFIRYGDDTLSETLTLNTLSWVMKRN